MRLLLIIGLTATLALAAPASAPGAGGDETPPVLSALSLSPPSFVSGGRGTTVSYRLSEAAIVSFEVERAGRVLPGAFDHLGVSGLNRVRFDGRLHRRALPPGRYRLVARALDAGLNQSARVGREFRASAR